MVPDDVKNHFAELEKQLAEADKGGQAAAKLIWKQKEALDKAEKREAGLRAALVEFIEAEWMVIPAWSGSEQRGKFLDKMAQLLGYKDAEDFAEARAALEEHGKPKEEA